MGYWYRMYVHSKGSMNKIRENKKKGIMACKG